MNKYNPDIVTHPGITLDEMMKDKSIECADICDPLDVPELSLLRIRCDNYPITERVAKLLEYYGLGDANFWMSRQKNYDDYILKIKRKDAPCPKESNQN